MSFRHCVITGASSGLGRALAEKLARPDCVLGLLGRNSSRLEATARQVTQAGALARTGLFDLRDAEALKAYLVDFDHHTPIDLFIANAGIFEETSEKNQLQDFESVKRVFEVNLLATLQALHYVIPLMQARRTGTIVLVSSLAAFLPLAHAPAYSASKAALISYGRALQPILAQDHVKLCIACPGYIDTPMIGVENRKKRGIVSAADAATRLLKGAERGQSLIGFPRRFYYLARFIPLLPPPLYWAGYRLLRRAL